MPVIISGPPVADPRALSHDDLVRHAESLQRYGWKVFDAVGKLLELNEISRETLVRIIDAHEAGNVEELVMLLQACADGRREAGAARQSVH